MLVFLFSCSSPPISIKSEVQTDIPDQNHEFTDTEEPSAEPGVEETNTDTDTGLCPSGMAGVPNDSPLYCIDIFEVMVEDGMAISAEGLIPSPLYSFQEAQEICESTPVYNDAGEAIAYKRLASLDEWVDAADGVIGDGGYSYAYGDEWVEHHCATPLANGEVVYDEIQAGGSFPNCMSVFGVYDQIGNLWEWADPLQDIDIDGFFQKIEESEITITVTEDNLLFLIGDPDLFLLDVAGAQNRLIQAEDGILYASQISADIESSDMTVHGYLRFDFHPTQLSGVFLPIKVHKVQASNGYYPLELVWDRDGFPLTAKTGCAYYVGDANSCQLHSAQFSHAFDFLGTIGFRCSLPYPYQSE